MSGPRSRFGLRSTSPASSIKCDRRVIVWSGDGHCTPAPAQSSKWARLTRPRRLCATRLRGASQKRIVKEPVIASGRYSSYRSTVIPENLQIFTISLIISWPLFLLPGYSPRVAVAKVAQKRRFHQGFRSFPITLNGSAITIGAMPPSEIRGKNRASCTFSGSILSSRVIATFRPNRAAQGQPPPQWPPHPRGRKSRVGTARADDCGQCLAARRLRAVACRWCGGRSFRRCRACFISLRSLVAIDVYTIP